MEPFRVALLDLIDQTVERRQVASYLPSAESPAMGELAIESSFAGQWGKEPVRDAQSASWMILSAGEDIIRSMCRLFEFEELPVYGHLVLARASLESCARAAWLAEPGIGVKMRVARGMSERLYSMAEAAKLRGAPTMTERRRQILDEAATQGFRRISHRNQSVVALEKSRPGNTALVGWLFGAHRELGDTMYRYWAAVSHSTLYGLAQSLDRDVAQSRKAVDSLVTVGLATRTDQVAAVIGAVTLAYIEVGQFHRDLFGWHGDDWNRTVVNCLALMKTLSTSA